MVNMLRIRKEITQFLYLQLQIHLQDRKKGNKNIWGTIRNYLIRFARPSPTCTLIPTIQSNVLVKNNIHNSIANYNGGHSQAYYSKFLLQTMVGTVLEFKLHGIASIRVKTQAILEFSGLGYFYSTRVHRTRVWI